jgi:hypothetical protein
VSRSCARTGAALTALLLLLGSAALLPVPRLPAQRPPAAACLLLSPNVDEGLDVAEARRRLRSPQHARYRRLAGDILDQLGVQGHRIHDALGEWQGGIENSLLVVLPHPADAFTLSAAAAWFGLAAQQKAVLAFRADPAGPDVLVVLDLPERSLAEARALLDRQGLRDRTLLPAEGGWRAVVLVRGGHLAMPLPASGWQIQRGQGVFLGEPTRAAATARYREILRAYRAARPGGPVARLGQ